ncbi:Regulator of nonsense transcripts 3A, partial [Galemys pyrenaicus]
AGGGARGRPGIARLRPRGRRRGRRRRRMRSEKEGAGGPGAAVAARGPSGKEKLPALEVQFRRESPRREPEAPPTPSPGCGSGAGKPREEKRTVLSKLASSGQRSPSCWGCRERGARGGPGRARDCTSPRVLPQVVIRRLPPSLTREQLEEQLCPLPAHDYFEFFTADFSLYPHLYSRAYINFRNPDDILLFRDRFDGYIFIDSKGLEYPAVVEFAPFQKIARKKLKKKDAKTGSIEDDPEYKKFLETYRVEEEKTSANPETLLGDIEARTRALPGAVLRRGVVSGVHAALWVVAPRLGAEPVRCWPGAGAMRPSVCAAGPGPGRPAVPSAALRTACGVGDLRIREEKREERRRRDLEKKRLREEEKRKSREEEQCQRREADRHKRAAERGVRVQLLKKPDKGEEPAAERPDDRGQDASGAGEGRREPPAGCAPLRPEGPAREPLQR